MNRPIKYCYWVSPGKLLAGEYPRDRDPASSKQKLRSLMDSGVTTFIDLTQVGELDPYLAMIGSASHQRFPIRDGSIPSAQARTIATLDAIDSHLADGRCVYVHCWGGIGRTGLIVGCWLARHGLKGPAALSRLQELWQHNPKSAWARSPETPAQERYILDWETGR